MAPLIDPTGAGFLLVENRSMPMHVGGLQIYRKPEDAGRDYGRQMYEQMCAVEELSPLFRKHPHRSLRTAGQLTWVDDAEFDIEHHVRHSALPRPGRARELLELVGRLHSTRLAWERPLWEAHIIEGMRDGRVAIYTKTHHALLDGVSAMRLLQGVLSTDPDRRDMPPPWDARTRPERLPVADSEPWLPARAAHTLRSALQVAADASGLPGALARTVTRSARNQTSPISLHAPRTIFNQQITGARRFAAQAWPIQRLKSISRASGTTINDVVLAMCAGAVRTYLLELDALPDAPLVAMVPVGINARESHVASVDGGNALGAVMCQLGTHLDDPADRLQAVHDSMLEGKQVLEQMTPAQILAMSALGQAPAILMPLLGVDRFVRPPYNLVISNVPGPRTTHYWNGARLEGSYPLSIPINGMALNITCNSYDGNLDFGLIGCRRTVPRLQRMLGHLDTELAALERATGVSAAVV